LNWITNFVRPKIRAVLRRRETPDDLWTKCPACGQMIFQKDLATAQYVCPHCDHHMKLDAKSRFESVFDGAFEDIAIEAVPLDPLKFRDEKRYIDRLKEAKAKTGLDESIRVAAGTLDRVPLVVAVQSFAFLGGSLGMAAGAAMVSACETAIKRRAGLVVFTASGGARMQEGILSLMQMPRTTVAVSMLREAGLPYIVVLTDPTTGGVTASYAMLGDIQIAEPNALIGLSGPRVIEQTIRERLPEGFQRSEYLLDHGIVDMVVHRHHMREHLSRIVRHLMRRGPNFAGQVPARA
jgi:acetyl-CoA carboxylase carboxyl transferase subunit beta